MPEVPASVNNNQVAERTMFCATTVAIAHKAVVRAMIQNRMGWMASIVFVRMQIAGLRNLKSALLNHFFAPW